MLHAVPRHALIVLADRVLHVVRGPGGVRLRGAVTGSPASPSPGALLEETLPQLKCPARVDVILGSPWTRVDLIGLPAAPPTPTATLAAIAQAHAEGLPPLSGQAPLPWQTRVFRLRQHLLVAAMTEPDIAGLLAALARQHIAARALHPLFTWLTLGGQPGFAGRHEWIALLEPGFATLAHLAKGEPDVLQTVRIDDDAIPPDAAFSAALATRLSRLSAAAGIPAGPVETLSVAAPSVLLAAPWAGGPANSLPAA